MPAGGRRSGWPERQHWGPWVAAALPAVLFVILLLPTFGIALPGVSGVHVEPVEDLPDETWEDRDLGYLVTTLGLPGIHLVTYNGQYVIYEEVPGGYEVSALDDDQMAEMEETYGPLDQPSWWTRHSAAVVLPLVLGVSATLVVWGLQRASRPIGVRYRSVRVLDPGTGDRVELTAREDVTIGEVRQTVLDQLGQGAQGYRLRCHGQTVEDDRRVGDLSEDEGVDLVLAKRAG